MTEPADQFPPLVFTLDRDGVELNMNFICPTCNLELRNHDVEVFSDKPSKIRFVCREGEEGVDESIEG